MSTELFYVDKTKRTIPEEESNVQIPKKKRGRFLAKKEDDEMLPSKEETELTGLLFGDTSNMPTVEKKEKEEGSIENENNESVDEDSEVEDEDEEEEDNDDDENQEPSCMSFFLLIISQILLSGMMKMKKVQKLILLVRMLYLDITNMLLKKKLKKVMLK